MVDAIIMILAVSGIFGALWNLVAAVRRNSLSRKGVLGNAGIVTLAILVIARTLEERMSDGMATIVIGLLAVLAIALLVASGMGGSSPTRRS